MKQVPFSEMNLSPETMRVIEEMGFENATEIQSRSIPLIKEGLDVIGRSQTGTGKTVAFGIPAIDIIDTTPEEKRKVQVLILCPTRELAMQACDELQKLAKFKHGVKVMTVYGGAPMDRQILALKKGVNIVVGTPGRVMDHMRRRTLKLGNLKMVVLDEADEMLSMGFREDIETILSDAPEERQTILFSATMPESIMNLTKLYQKNPEIVQVDKQNVTIDGIKQTFYNVPMGRKPDALNLLLMFYKIKLAIVFCNTKRGVDEVSEYLIKHGFAAKGLHGDMKQQQRTKVLDEFKNGDTNILVATDVAARGIDVDSIEYVINYDIPQNSEYYIHRIGRTGRAGKEGCAVTLCSGKRSVTTLMRMAGSIKVKIEEKIIPSADDVQKGNKLAHITELEKILTEKTDFSCNDIAFELTEKGFTYEQIAKCTLDMLYGTKELSVPKVSATKRSRSDRDDRDDRGDRGDRGDRDRGDRDSSRRNSRDGGRPERRRVPSADRNSSRGGFKKMAISIGRDQKIAPNFIVGAITDRTGLRGREIGKIEIFDNKTIVEVPSDKLNDVVTSMKNCKINGVKTTTKIV